MKKLAIALVGASILMSIAGATGVKDPCDEDPSTTVTGKVVFFCSGSGCDGNQLKGFTVKKTCTVTCVVQPTACKTRQGVVSNCDAGQNTGGCCTVNAMPCAPNLCSMGTCSPPY